MDQIQTDKGEMLYKDKSIRISSGSITSARMLIWRRTYELSDVDSVEISQRKRRGEPGGVRQSMYTGIEFIDKYINSLRSLTSYLTSTYTVYTVKVKGRLGRGGAQATKSIYKTVVSDKAYDVLDLIEDLLASKAPSPSA